MTPTPYTEEKVLICEECGEACDIIQVDHGGYEEVWGAKVWHPMPTDVTDCCQTEYWNEVPNEASN